METSVDSREFEVGALWTDGSGHVDGFCGSAWVAVTPFDEFPLHGLTAFSHGGVDRAELLAMADALRVIQQKAEKAWRKPCPPMRLHLEWFTDRKSLVEHFDSQFQNPKGDSADLWVSVKGWLATPHLVVNLRPQHVDRNVQPFQRLCDTYAGNARRWIKQEMNKFSKGDS